MTLIRFNRPGSDVAGRRFSDIMDEFFNDALSTRQSTFAPSIDVSETEKQYIIDVEVPGMDKKDIDLNVDNNTLTISGERKFEKEEDGKQYHRVESHYGSFSRTFTLPDNADIDTINASYKNGILNITVNKSEKSMKKQIDIK